MGHTVYLESHGKKCQKKHQLGKGWTLYCLGLGIKEDVKGAQSVAEALDMATRRLEDVLQNALDKIRNDP